MYDFECHYREERWQTARYFDFVRELLIAAQNRDDSDDCDPPPCTTTPRTVTTEEYLKGEYYNIICFILYMLYISRMLCFVNRVCICQFSTLAASNWQHVIMKKYLQFEEWHDINDLQITCKRERWISSDPNFSSFWESSSLYSPESSRF